MPAKPEARRLDAQIECAIAEGRWRDLRRQLEHGTHASMSVKEYAEHYLEVYCKVQNVDWQRKASSLKHVGRLMGRKSLSDMSVSDIHLFVAKRLKESVKAATVNRDVMTLKHMMEFAVEEGALVVNPIRRVRRLKELREERPRPSDEQVEAVMGELSFPVKQAVTFIYETGCRPSEALKLKRAHVDYENKTAMFNMRKAGDNALVALTSRAIKALQEVPELPGCPYVFWNPKTQTRYEKINNTFERARKRAGVPWLQLKDFRRELGIILAESGQPLHVAKTQLGHSSVRTTEEFYARYSPEFAISRARDVLEQRGNGRKTGGEPPEPENPPAKIEQGENCKVIRFKVIRGR